MYEIKEWPVRVYRKSSRGWQMLVPKNAKGRRCRVSASLREGCILIPRVKVRIHLRKKKDDCHDEKSKQQMLVQVIRRRDAVAVSGIEPLRTAIVLKFRSEEECKEFADGICLLNPSQALEDSTPPVTGNRKSDGRHGDESTKQDVLSYIARLINDPSFLAYVHGLENCLTSTEDGKQMLDALAKSNPSKPEDTC